MSAAIVPFTGAWQGHTEPSPYQRKVQSRVSRAEARALHDARLIRSAKRENDDWTAHVLLALLQTLDREQLERLELHMGPPTSESAVEALAVVQLFTAPKGHRERVRLAVGMLAERGAE